MSLALPAALLGLLFLPLVWWLHRRLRRPPDVQLPSLMFLADEEDVRALPRGRVIDAELLLALSALILLTFAAAGPQIVRSSAHREVQIVVSGGSAGEQRGYQQRVAAVLADVRAGLAPEDVEHVVYEPALPERGRYMPRPSTDALLAAARAGRRSLRIVISDRAPPGETGDVHWVSVGEPGATNAGIVAASVQEDSGRPSAFFTVASHTEGAGDATLVAVAFDAGGRKLEESARKLRMPRRGLVSGSIVLPRESERITLRLGDAFGLDRDDSLSADDVVVLTRSQLRVYLHPEVEGLHEPARAALRAALGETGFLELSRDQAPTADLALVPSWAPFPGQAWILSVRPASDSDGVERAPPGGNPTGRDPLVADLSGAGPEWIYADGARELPAPAEVLLERVAPGGWPLVARTDRRVHLVPDPLRGQPAPVDTPFWPVLVDNVVRAIKGGQNVGLGYRAQGILDPATSAPGRVRLPFDPAWLASAEPSVPARARPLRGPLILGALSCLVLLWGAPRLRRRITPTRAAQAPGAMQAG